MSPSGVNHSPAGNQFVGDRRSSFVCGSRIAQLSFGRPMEISAAE